MNNYHLKKKRCTAFIAIIILVNIIAGGVTVQAAGPISTWTSSAQDATSGSRILGMTYTNGMFISCGDFENIGTSLDGSNWTKKYSSSTQVGFKAIAYNGTDTYVVVGTAGKLAVSSNLTEWSFKDTLNSDSTSNTSEFYGVAYGNGNFIAVTIDGEIYKSADNGNTWVLKESDSNNNFFGVTYVTYLNKFLAYGNGSVMLLSSDGDTWTQASSTDSPISYRSVAYKSDGVGGIIVAVGASGQIRTSIDADSWTDRISNTSQHLNSITYGDNGLSSIFLVVGSSGGAVLSYDGLNWTEAPGIGINTGPVAYGNNTFVTCKTNDTQYYPHSRTLFTKFNTSNITGYVRDKDSSASISGATVSLTVGNEKVSAVTDENGAYTINGAPSGTNRTVIANQTGYRSSAEEVDITAGAVLNLDFSLEADSVAPTLLSPDNNRTGVSTTAPILLEFSEDIKIGENIGTELADGDVSWSELSGAGFKFGTASGSNDSDELIESVYYNQSTNTMIFRTNGFASNTNYYLTIDGIYDMSSNALDSISLHFTTGDLTKVSNRTIVGISVPVTDTTRATTPPVNGDMPASVEWTSGDITWYNDGQISSGITTQNTAYEAHFTLTPKLGYTFAGISPTGTGFFDESKSVLKAEAINYQANETNPIALDVIITYPATENSSITPTATTTRVVKATVVQKSVDFVLSNSQALSGTWKVYKDSSTTIALTTVIPTYNDGTKTLTLTSTETDIPAATYYVTHTDSDKAESKRLKLIAADATGAPTVISCDLDMGNVTITTNADGDTFHVYYNDASSESGNVDVDYAKKIEIKKTNTLVPTQYHITVNGTNQPTNTPIQISLKSVNIDPRDTGSGGFPCPAFSLINNANVNLTLNGSNTLQGYGGYAALQVPEGNSVTIDGTGSLIATGGAQGAGIGGNGTSGDIAINGGNITAKGGDFAAGIGNKDDNKSVVINGGNINAIGGLYAAGIGGGNDGNGGTITITGGTVVAKGSGNNIQYVGAGIGGGGGGNAIGKGAGGTINISGSADVTAIGGRAVSLGTVYAGSGIGGAYGAADNGKITITGTPKIKAVSATSGMAITASDSSSTVGVISADFASEISAGIETELCTNTGESINPDSISICPLINYQSVAFAVLDNNTYWIKKGGTYQIHNTSGAYSSDFNISTAGLISFTGLKNETMPAKVVSITPANAATGVLTGIGTIKITFDEDINISPNSGSELPDGPLTWSSLPSTLSSFKFGTTSGQNDAAVLITGASYNKTANTLTLTVGKMTNSTTYYLTIDGITDVAGNGVIKTEKSFTTMVKIGKIFNIDTAVPVTGSVMTDGVNMPPTGVNNPIGTWSTDGVNYFEANGSYISETSYKTKYVYSSQDGYEFNPTTATTDINGSDIGVGKGTVISTSVSKKINTNDTLIVVIKWPTTEAPPTSATPTADSSEVTKTSTTQDKVNFTLTNNPALTGTWQVYEAAIGTTKPSGITVSVNGSILTLEHATDVMSGTYYVAVTESGKTESDRLALTVAAYMAPPTSATPTVDSSEVTKISTTQDKVNFTLTNSPALTGTWQVYEATTGTNLPSGITVSVNGSILTLEHATDVMSGTYYVAVTESGKTESDRLALTVAAYIAPPTSATPTVDSLTVTKISTTQDKVNFTLTNNPALTETWQVYEAETGTNVPEGITVSVNGSILTLEHTTDVMAGTYYVAVTESGKTESDRLALTVAAYMAPPTSATPTVDSVTVTKISTTQDKVNFTLTNNPALTGTWQVYEAETGTNVPEGITVSVNGSILTLEHTTDVMAGTYYVAVTESGKTESDRLALTVQAYEEPIQPGQSATPAVASSKISKTSATQDKVNFTLTNSPALTGTWQVYEAAAGTTTPAGITVSVNGSILTLEHATDLMAGTYYVTATESGKTESDRLALTVQAYEEPVQPGQSATPAVASSKISKTSTTQDKVNFTLINNLTLTCTWQVYSATAGTTTPTGIKVSVNGSILTLEHATDVVAGTYYVSVTESGKTESSRLTLIVEAYIASPNENGGDSSSGKGSSITVNTENQRSSTIIINTKPDSNGKVSATSVTESQITGAINQAIEDIKNGQDTAAKVGIKVNAHGDVKTVETSIHKSAVQALAWSNIDILTVSTSIANITFDSKSIDTIAGEDVGEVKITVAKVDLETLSIEIKQAVGSRPVFNFSVVSGSKTISKFGGSVTVSIPYTQQLGEDNNAIVIYCINAQGKPEIVSNCVYNSETGMITFKTTHFSKYAVGYNKVNFKDVDATDWYSNAVDFVSARGIATGTGNGNYSPEAKLTRGQFLVMVMKAYGISVDENAKDNYSDAGNTYYTDYLAAAKKLGITVGIGNNMFAPDKEITRQEMFTLLYNIQKQINELPTVTTGKSLTTYSDAKQIESWAKDAMTLFVWNGTIRGNEGKLNPTDTTNRAEMAQVLYNLMTK